MLKDSTHVQSHTRPRENAKMRQRTGVRPTQEDTNLHTIAGTQL